VHIKAGAVRIKHCHDISSMRAAGMELPSKEL
jgi:hypothetical protein